MDERESKLLSNNPIIVTKTIATLTQAIKDTFSKQNERNKSFYECKDLKYLKKKCTCDSTLVCLTSGKALVSLVEEGVLESSVILSDILSLLTNAECYSGIISVICELLLCQMKQETNQCKDLQKQYFSHYNLIGPQHPLIPVLLHNSTLTSSDILQQIKHMYLRTNLNLHAQINELLRTFYIFVFCDYDQKIVPIFKQRLWTFLLPFVVENEYLLLNDLLSWSEISSKEDITQLSNFLMETANFQLKSSTTHLECTFLHLSYILQETITKSCDPKTIINYSLKIIEAKPNMKCLNMTLLILSDCITNCPFMYLQDLLSYCKAVISNALMTNIANLLIFKSIKASCLLWMLQSNFLIENCDDLIKEIFNFDKLIEKYSPKTEEIIKDHALMSVVSSNEYLSLVFELSVLAENSNDKMLLNWLEHLKDIQCNVLKKMFGFLSGLFITNFKNAEVPLKILDILLLIVKNYKDMSTNLLTLLLYRISNTTNEYLHCKVLKSIPKMGVFKGNISLIVSVLQKLSDGGKHLKTFSLTLFYDLWCVQVRCYRYLQNILVENEKSRDGEFQIVKAYILMELCRQRPELYGTELAAHLSSILNKSKSSNEMATFFALKGLKCLCKQGIVDIDTAWITVAPGFEDENRSIVIQSICDLLTDIAALPDTEQNDKLIKEVTKKLWDYAIYNSDVDVNFSAYQALESFSLVQVSYHLSDVINESGDLAKPDNFGFVPGTHWILLLQNINYAAIKILGNFLITLMSKEIQGYHKGTYYIGDGRREPENFNSLPYYSIVRAIGNHVKQNATTWQKNIFKEAYIECLRILSVKYSKPLPPFDWCFLQELVHFSESRYYCISLASNQVILSGTARRFMENFILALTNECTEEDILVIYENLKQLMNSIQPMIMKPFFENSLLSLVKNVHIPTLKVILNNIKEALQSEEVQETNKSVISQILIDLIRNLGTEHELFEVFINCAVSCPVKYINELSGVSNPKEIISKNTKLCIYVKCAVAMECDRNPFSHLNDMLNIISTFHSEHNYCLSRLEQVFKKCKNHKETTAWIIEFLGQIQVTLADEKYFDVNEIFFYCDVFILAILVFSGFFIFGNIMECDVRCRLFPQALKNLLENENWKFAVSQILEWLLHMSNFKKLPLKYRETFNKALIQLRQEVEFKESFRWMKYVGNRITV